MGAALDDVGFIALDCQATGPSPRSGALLELGWSVSAGIEALVAPTPGEVCSELVRLPEGDSVPRQITRLTGIEDTDLVGARSATEVWRTVLARIEALRSASSSGASPPIVAVAHYARYERAFLEDLHQAVAPGAPLPFDLFCTHEIGRRLYPELPRCGLRALAGYLGYSLELARRAGPHAKATAFVWAHLIRTLDARGVRTIDDLSSWLEDEARPARGRRVYPMPRERRLALPDAPGVYRLLRGSGDLLYVGKATSLRSRVNSHFTKSSKVKERALEMLSQAQHVDFTVTATALEAALLEVDEIKLKAPPYNVALTERDRDIWFCAPDLLDFAPQADSGHPIGPLSSPRSVRSLPMLAKALARGGIWTTAPEGFAGEVLSVPSRRAPDPETFARGVLGFRLAAGLGRDETPRDLRAWMRLGRRLWAEDLASAALPGADDDVAVLLSETPAPIDRWDPEKVANVLRENVKQAALQLRRAVWLTRLVDSVIAWSDGNEEASSRIMVLERGRVEAVRDRAEGEGVPVPPGASRSRSDRRACLDLATYDRLRVLTTELKRLSRLGGASVRFVPTAVLAPPLLEKVLRWL